ncbi:HAMP domain-containing protein [Halobacillus litoralis]|uniref:Heme sensor protein HssS n=1 Tax=Halobacillus litoralis TaxID=45668 RepID=A0A845DSI6_9BACI|nr:sensor histidine kinase [Halobacillus litoralis]MYL20591.1 HAMP domain-containing protein [Halobacillus litoralis]
MKSLYAQIVVTFIAAIVIGLVITFSISGRLHALQVAEKLETQMVNIGKEFIELYKKEPDTDADLYLDAMSSGSFEVLLFKDDAEESLYYEEGQDWDIDQADVERVLNGDVHNEYLLPPRINIGLPFEKDGSSYALFLRPDFEFFFEGFRQIVLILFLTVLLIGSFVFILSTRWIVRPIKAMTETAGELAKGNFDVQVETKRKDELGSLAHSFNQMAHGLGELDGMRQQFVSNVSHEIQSPLTSIQGFARALKDGVVTDEENRQAYYDIIEKESRRLSTLSQNLLKLATLDSDHPPYEPSSYKLDEQLRRVLAHMQPQWADKKINIDADLEGCSLYGDADQLEQVWVNILSNAIRHTQTEGTIAVRLKADEDGAEVTIIDDGEGMRPEDQQRIFERFYKADKSRTRKQGGSGLGLSIAEKIVQLHDGAIHVTSRPGEGAAFTVHLPRR